jgi:hypothetical protein
MPGENQCPTDPALWSGADVRREPLSHLRGSQRNRGLDQLRIAGTSSDDWNVNGSSAPEKADSVGLGSSDLSALACCRTASRRREWIRAEGGNRGVVGVDDFDVGGR